MKNRKTWVIALAFLLVGTFTFLSACKKKPPTTAPGARPVTEEPTDVADHLDLQTNDREIRRDRQTWNRERSEDPTQHRVACDVITAHANLAHLREVQETVLYVGNTEIVNENGIASGAVRVLGDTRPDFSDAHERPHLPVRRNHTHFAFFVAGR